MQPSQELIAIQTLERKGVSVEISSDWISSSFKHATSINGNYIDKIKDNDLYCINSLPRIKNISMRGTSIQGEFLSHAIALDSLEFLDVGESNFNDTYSQLLLRFSRLSCVFLDKTCVSESIVNVLTAIRSLEIISLEGVHIPRESLSLLCGHVNLKTLRVSADLATQDDANLMLRPQGCNLQIIRT